MKPFGKGLRVFIQLFPVVLIFWIFIFLRWHNIGKYFPYFIDEIHHMRRARAVWTLNDLHTSTTPGKFLLYYWLGAFQFPEYPSLWLLRTPAAMFSLLGAAGTFALTKILFNRKAAFLALGILVVFPFTLFYERLALSDPLTASLAVLMTWWSVVVARYPSIRNATILAVFWCLMLAGKIVAFPLVIVPFLALAFFCPTPISFKKPLREEIQRLWHEYHPEITRASLIIMLVWGSLIGFYQTRKIIDPTTRAIVDDYLYGGVSNNLGLSESNESQIEINLGRFKDAFVHLWGPLLIGLALVALAVLLRQRWRIAVFILSVILPYWAFILFVAGQLNSRYLTLIAHLCVAAIAGGLMVLQDEIANRIKLPPVRWIPTVLVMVWIISFGWPFARTAMHNPTTLDLPNRDKSEYFRNHTGYALPDGLEYIVNSDPISSGIDVPVVLAAFVRICEYLPYYMPTEDHDNIYIECSPPERGRFLKRYDELNAALNKYEAVYVLVEQYRTPDGSIVIDPALVNGDLELLATFPRPHDGVKVEVYVAYTQSVATSLQE